MQGLELIAARRLLLMVTLLSYPVVLGLAAGVGLDIDYVSFLKPCCYVLAMLVVFGGYCHARRMRFFSYTVETSCCVLLLAPPVLISTYIAMKFDMPLADHVLIHADEMIGINWRAVIAFVDGRPLLAEVLGFAYQSFIFQLLALPFLLIVAGSPLRAYRMVIAYAVICFVASAVSVWCPAVGTYVAYGLKETDVVNINAHFAFFFLDEFNAVRSDPHFVLKLQGAAGILTFPSVHAAVATLCAWAGWGNRYLRYPALALNVLMAVSAVTHANHYVVDVLAGNALTALCLLVVIVATTKRTKSAEAWRTAASAV